MRVLLTTLPGVGHLHPMVPVAQALQQSGHEVAFACAQAFCPRIEIAGFHSFPTGLNWLESEAEQSFTQLRKLSPEQQSFWFVTDVFAGIAAQQMIPDLFHLCRSWKPDIIVRGEFEFGGCVVAERLDIPHAAISLGLFLPVNIWKSIIGEQINLLRSAHGLPPDPDLCMLYRYLYLAFAPPSYQFPDLTLPPIFHSLRPTVFDRSGDEELPAWVYHLPKRPTVHATLGTIFNRATEIYQTIIEGLRDEPINLILTIGRNQDPAQFGPQPPNVYIERYIPHTLLLPYCDLVITHGGASTTVSVLSHGLPLLVIPLSADQPFHAMRCAALGVGCVVKQPGLFDAYLSDRCYSELSPQAVRSAVQELLQNPRYRQNAQRLREEMLSLPGPERAVELLTELVMRERSPGVNQI